MSESNETIADIVAEMRSGLLSATVECEECGEVREQRFRFDGLADRIEAAWKRETHTYIDQIRDAMNQFWHEKFKAEHAPVGNAAAIREALDRIGNTAVFVAENCGNKLTSKYMTDIIMDVQAAVSAPPRNCDVGTAEEQDARFVKWRYSNPLREELGLDALAWAQMPYEKGEGDGK